MLSSASLRGHLKHNGTPGWQTLARGYETLRTLTTGWTFRRAVEAGFSSLSAINHEAGAPKTDETKHQNHFPGGRQTGRSSRPPEGALRDFSSNFGREPARAGL